jgi:3-methyladenine DNA glycosylase AlkD
MTTKEIIVLLKELGNPDVVEQKEKRFGVIAKNSLGIYHKELKLIAKELPKNDTIAIELFDTGIYEARLLCSKIFSPKNLTEELMEKWVKEFDNWEICDSFCMGIFAKSKWAFPKAVEWCNRESEFEKRASFAIMAAYCMADKKADNSVFKDFLQLIEHHSDDERLYVKKAVNWALRNIGKRNIDLRREAILLAEKLSESDNKATRWIGSNAFKELTAEKVRSSDYPRKIYRP